MCMQVKNNINSNINTQNFNGIYRIKKADSGLIDEIQTFVKPMYEQVKRRAVLAFYGDNPVDIPLVSALDKITKKESTSYQWLVQNAKNHGIRFVDKNNCDVWVFTDKDVDIVTNTLGYAVRDFEKPNLFFNIYVYSYILAIVLNRLFLFAFHQQVQSFHYQPLPSSMNTFYRLFLHKYMLFY